MKSQNMSIFTRTPLHVGAGNSVGAIDSPVMREKHTAFPIIPASTLKGVLSDEMNDFFETDEKDGEKLASKRTADGAWMFGSEQNDNACAGSVMIGEAKIIAFPVRSAKGSFAWITCPLAIARAINDKLLDKSAMINVTSDSEAIVNQGSIILLGEKIVLEEYAINKKSDSIPTKLIEGLTAMLPNDDIWGNVASRLAIVSDGMMTYFVQAACEVAQHVKIDDVTGTAQKGGLFNQENIPSETMFYAPIMFTTENGKNLQKGTRRNAEDAATKFSEVYADKVFQFGGNASTGIGYCSVNVIK